MIFNQFHRLLFSVAEAQRKAGVSDRMGYVHEVKQEGGEQKMRAVIGFRPDGSKLLSPWLHSTDQRGATSKQEQFKKGQNIRVSGTDGDWRQATISAAHEGRSFPQPKHAPEIYGNSFQAGKLRRGEILPKDDDDDGQGSSGVGGSSGGSSGSSAGGSGDKNHRHELWIAKEDDKAPKHQDQQDSPIDGGSGQSSQAEGQQQQQKKKAEAAVMVSTDEKDGYTARIGEGEKAVRVAAHEKGFKGRAGETYYAAEKDKDAISNAKGDNHVQADQNVYVDCAQPYVCKPWKIKSNRKKESIPNDDKLNGKSGSGGGG